MATRGTPLDAATVRAIQRVAAVLSVRKTAREVRVSPTTVVKYKKRPG